MKTKSTKPTKPAKPKKTTKPKNPALQSLQSHPPNHAAAGEKAFAALRPKLLALPSDSLTPVIIDVQLAGITALSVANAISADTVLRARFEALAKAKEFAIEKLDGLATAALAAWFARHMYLLASATHTEAQLPASLVTIATTLKTRMMRVVEYHLGDHPVAGALVAAIRAGTGYMDLANDLVALARLYETYAHLLEHDQKDYKPEDQSLAADTGDRILTLLGGNTPEQRKWAELQARAWTLLNADYAEVYAAGRFLKRADHDVESAFPSLVAASRAAAKSAPAAEPATTPAQGDGALANGAVK